MPDVDNPERSTAQNEGVARVKRVGATQAPKSSGVDNANYQIVCGERTGMPQARIGVIAGRERIGHGRLNSAWGRQARPSATQLKAC